LRHALERTRTLGPPDTHRSARLTGLERRALAGAPLAYLHSRVRMRGVRAPWEQAR
ncbi:hypothetical protein GT354_13780, partial [Streptomyces sp. SID3343]|nr:hypothetical protein [Streptomyces sp. SID3343]